MIKKFTRLKKSMLALFFLLQALGTFSQCDNIGFESGNTSAWVCGSGTFGMLSPVLCSIPVFPTTILYDGNCLNEGGINGTGTPVNPAQNRHTIMGTGMDYNSQNTVPCVAPANLFPTGVNNYSFRLGNAVAGAPQPSLAYAEAIKYTITVTPANAGLTYLYAVFVKEAMPMHMIKENSHFEVKITDANKQTIDCGYLMMSASSPNLKDGLVDVAGTWKYSDWRKVSLNLTKYIGQTLTLEFITADCYPTWGPATGDSCGFASGSHSAYAYIDMYCAPIEISSPVVCANQSTVQICAPDGYAPYYWPSGQPGIQPPYDQRCVTINNPKAGDAYTVNLTAAAGGCPGFANLILKGADFIAADVRVCKDAGPAQLTVTPVTPGNYTFKWEPQVNLNQYTIPNPLFTPGQSTTYTVTMSDAIVSNCNAIKTVHVEVIEKIIVSAVDMIIHRGETALLNGTVSAGGTGVWVGGMGTFAPDRSALNAVYTPTPAEETAGSVQLTLEATDTVGVCPKQSKTMTITILTPTAITTANKGELSMEVYPNPFTTELTISVSGLSNPAFAELKLVDFLGKEIRSQKLGPYQKMDRGDLPAGMYFIELREQGKVLARKKIVIND
jgi:hypothetical protein